MKDLWAICLDIYRQLYKEATPSADIDKLIASGETKKPNWFMKHHLPQRRQDKIMEEHIKKNHLNRRQAASIRNEIWLGSSPSGVERPALTKD